MAKLKTGVMISGRGSNLQALLDAAADAEFPATIALVISNEADAFGLERARRAGVPSAVIDHRPFGKDRTAFEVKLIEALEDAGVDFVCLAGFMRLLTPRFTRHWHDRLINIHPSLLPAFKGLDTHERALAAGVRLHGCTVHFVRPEMDDGPIIAQAAVPVLDADTPATLAARVLEQEHLLYPEALRLAGEGRLRILDERVTIRDHAAPAGAFANPIPRQGR